jgi:gamma-glutamylcyclotransferase (GGCT)/AIG2-like uncharacterized protein YtfP
MRIFVYGTLRNGEHNHHYVSENLVNYLGVYKTVEKYYMIQNTGYSFPYVVPSHLLELDEKPVEITGEVYEITKEGLEKIDLLEGVPDHYMREVITVQSNEGNQKAQAFVYLMKDMRYLQHMKEGIPLNYFVILKGGDWKHEHYSKR